MATKIKRVKRNRFSDKRTFYQNQRLIILILIFAFGIFLGAYLNKGIHSDSIKEMTDGLYLKLSSQSFFENYFLFVIPDIMLLACSIFLGFSLYGDAGLILIPFIKGLFIGLINGSLIKHYDVKGFLISLIFITLTNSLPVCSLIISCKENMLSSGELRQIVKGENIKKSELKITIIRSVILLLIIIISYLITLFIFMKLKTKISLP